MCHSLADSSITVLEDVVTRAEQYLALYIDVGDALIFAKHEVYIIFLIKDDGFHLMRIIKNTSIQFLGLV